MDSFKTGHGACRVSDDTLHVKSGRGIIFYRFIEFHQKWFAALLFSFFLMGVALHYGGPRPLDRFLGLLELIGWMILVSIGLGILLSVLVYGSELKEGIANLRDPDTRTSGQLGQKAIPLDSISYVEVAQTGNPSVLTHDWLVLHFDDARAQKPNALSFLQGMGGERDKAIDIFEARGISVRRDT